MSIEIKISKKQISYKNAMLFLNKRVEEVKLQKNKELIWILEHPTTFTAGVSYNKKDIISFKVLCLECFAQRKTKNPFFFQNERITEVNC